MNKKIMWLIPIVLILAGAMLFLVSSQSEPDWVPPGNISLHDYYCILNPACIVGDLLLPDYNLTASWCKCKVNWSDVQNAPPALNVSNYLNLSQLNATYLNLSGTNANQNINITHYNLTANWFFGNLNASYVQNDPWIEDSQEGSLNVNSSNYWDSYNVPTDLNNLLTLDWANITNKFITAVDNIYLYMVGTTATFNETKLNESMDARFAGTYLNLSGTNANQNINISPYNLTANWFFGNLNWSYLQNVPPIITDTNCSVNGSCPNIIYWANESVLNVNSSNYWDSYNVPTDLNNLLTLDWANITNKFITAVDNIWVYMVGTTATFNETKLNETIDAKVTAGNTSMKTYVDATFITQANEGNLNVNSSTWWAGVSGWVSGWFKQTGNDLDFNETKLNETVVNIDGDNMTGNLNMTNNSVVGLYQVNFTDGGYIYDNGTALILGHT